MATITNRGNTFRITVSSGYDLHGKQLRKSMTWKPEEGMTKRQIEKEVQRQAVLFEEQVKNGLYVDCNIKFAEFADKWLKEYAEKQLKPKTVAQYRALLPRLNDGIGHLKISKLQPYHIMALYDELSREGIRADTKYKCTLDIKAELKQQKTTQKSLSERAGISIHTIESLARGNNVTKQTAEKIAKAMNNKFADMFKPVGDNKLSTQTIRHHHILLSSILSTAVQWQVIIYNPCERVKPPKVQQSDPRTLDDMEAMTLLDRLEQEDTQHRTMIQVLMFLGVRREELLGFKWSDIDFENGVISVERSIQYLPDKGLYESDTKTSSSHRVIKMSELVISALKKQRAAQREKRLQLGDRYTDCGYVFTKDDGTPIHPDSLTNWFKKFIRKNTLPDVTLHSLRHTNATLQIANGVPITTVAKRLGHANAGTTTKIYAHAIKTADEAAAEKINDIFSRKQA